MINQNVLRELRQSHLGEVLLKYPDKYASPLVLCKFENGKIYLTPTSLANIVHFDNFDKKLVEIHIYISNTDYFVKLNGKLVTMNSEQGELLVKLKSRWISKYPQFSELFSLRKRFTDKLEIQAYFEIIPNQVVYWNTNSFEKEIIDMEIVE